jgi:Arc/MetJ family transcription regulator
MRTNIDIDDQLMEEAQRLAGPKTKRAIVEDGLRALIRQKQRRKILDLAGNVEWVGNLNEMRQGRFFDEPR